MTFILKILGSNSAAPAHNRHQTSQLLNVQNQLFLIDCGEGTQLQLARNHVKINRINNIFISHLHGDHYFGLMGLISTMHLYGRQKKLQIFGPPGLSEIITLQLKYSESNLNFKINLCELENCGPAKIFENEFMTVETIPLSHRVFCNGFLFREKPKPRKINKERLPENFSLKNILKLKRGEDIFDDNDQLLYKNEDLTLPPKKS
ncbi:MAG: MBL fold metallo-hydrolase, partial [Cyclobacteriaceae bacterium]